MILVFVLVTVLWRLALVSLSGVGPGISQNLSVRFGIAFFGKELGASLYRMIKRRLDGACGKVPIELDELVGQRRRRVPVIIVIIGWDQRTFKEFDRLPASGKGPSKKDGIWIRFERDTLFHPFL